MFIDTDGFVCNITNHDVFKDMYRNDMFEMSCYDKSFKNYRAGNYEMGKIKDESPENVIIETICLKDKLYAVKRENEEVKCKGVNYDVNFKNLKNAVFNNEILSTKF